MTASSVSPADGFAETDVEQWRDAVRVALRGADPDSLATTTYDGIRIAPLATAAPDVHLGSPGARPFVRGATATPGWDVRALVREPDPVEAHRQALDELETGSTSLWLALGPAGTPVADLPTVLDGVLLDLAPVVLDAGAGTEAAAGALLARLAGVAPDDARGSLGADPIGLAARTGGGPDVDLLGRLAARAAAFPALCVSTVDATVYHDAGASDADEIAIATAVGVAYLRALVDAGRSVESALAALEFRFAVTADQFASIAKLRAARRVWARVGELSGAHETRGQRQHAVTSAVMLTRYDPWTNLLRATIGCFAAAVGGAESVTVLPFDHAIGLPDDFARRIARNTSAILHDESSLARVSDPAGGSYSVETLTDDLARRAWARFTELERAGGAIAALVSGRLGEIVAATRTARADDVAHRRAPVTGVTEFALPDEAPLPRRAAPSIADGGLAPARWAEPFERLRARVEARTPRPAVFLAALGPFADHGARVGFATNLFNAGGFRVVVGSPEDFVDAGTPVVCLCGSDDAYAVDGAAAASRLRGEGATLVWLAGRESTDGVDGFVHAGGDALAALSTTAARFGIDP